MNVQSDDIHGSVVCHMSFNRIYKGGIMNVLFILCVNILQWMHELMNGAGIRKKKTFLFLLFLIVKALKMSFVLAIHCESLT